MEKEILENNFETIYKEYKEYENYLNTISKEVEQEREKFKERVLASEDSDDILAEALFDLSIKPLQSNEDLRVLRDRLVNVYDAYKIVLDFPKEIKEEIRTLKRPLQAYRIYNGKQEEIDKERNDNYRKEAKKSHLQVISAIKISN